MNNELRTKNNENIMSEKIYIGVDFGGTKILTGAMNDKGEMVCEPVKVSTNANDDSGKIFKRVTDSIEGVLKKIDSSRLAVNSEKYKVEGIGLGVTGPIDIKNGVILECPQLPTMHFYPLKKMVEGFFPLPVYMNNDANCLIYGEALFGSGKGMNSIVGFTLGTGIGCAIVMDKKILNGSTDSAAEIWPSPYLDGTIEDYVSGSGVSKIYKVICNAGKAQQTADKTALEISQLAEKGDPDALKTWEEFGTHLAVALSWSVNLIDPDIVILGGSISNAYKFFSSRMEKELRKHLCPTPAERTKVVCANLGANAGFIGAASLALNNV